MLVVNHFLYTDRPVYFGHICLVLRYLDSSKGDVSAEMGYKSQLKKNLKVLQLFHPSQKSRNKTARTPFPRKLKQILFHIPCFCSGKTVALKVLIGSHFLQSSVASKFFF